jgi:hypothetical protein
VVDHVDASLDGHEDRRLVDDVAPDSTTPLVGAVDGGAELGRGHLEAILGGEDAVASGDEQLDHLGAPFHLVSDALAERLGAVADAGGTPGRHLPVPGVGVVAVAGGGELAAPGDEARAGDQAVVDRALHRRVDVVGRAGADRRREPALQRGREVLRGAQRLVGRRCLEPVRRRLSPELVVGGVEVARDLVGCQNSITPLTLEFVRSVPQLAL